MRLRKQRLQGMPPAQVEALGRLTPEELDGGRARPGARPQPGEDARAASAAPPLLIGGESPQATSPETAVAQRLGPIMDVSGLFEPEGIVLDRNQKPVIRPGVRVMKGQKVGIDWVSCVFEQTRAWRYYLQSDHLVFMENHEPVEPKEIALFVREMLESVLGLGDNSVARWREFPNGLNGYTYAIAMPHQAGIVHVGHTSKTVLLTISGHGAAVAKEGWEERLHWFLMAVDGWLTRVDFAFDDYQGDLFAVRKMRRQAKRGAFQRQGRPPKIELRGPWEQDDPEGMGLTLYIGSRLSGKLARIYEKGRQLGDPESPWVRFELELHNSCYQLTLEMLISPTKWFAGAYPCSEWIERAGERCSLEYKVRCAVASIENSIRWIKHQAGGHIAALREMYSDGELLDLLVRPDAIPPALLVARKVGDQVLAPSGSLTDEPGFVEA